jgi:hypothetical protein
MKKLIVAASIVFTVFVAPIEVAADYPPIPDGLGRRVETSVPAPTALADSAAVATKPGSLSIVVEPKPNLTRLTVSARNVATGRVTTRTVVVPAGSELIAPTLNLGGGEYRVKVTATLKSGRKVVWDAGRQRVRSRPSR